MSEKGFLHKYFDLFFTTKTVLVLALCVSIVAWYVSFTNNFVLTYNDGASHLNIGRRIIDNYTPGFAQIGTVWLPFPHMLMFLLAWNDFLWKTALAGSIVSMISYVLCVVFLYKLGTELTGKKATGLLAALILGLNPNLLYLQTTPMTESLLLAMFILAAYFLFQYLQKNSIAYLLGTGIFVLLSTLIRYDGWFLFFSLLGLIPLWATMNYSWKKAEGETFLFASIGGLGIILWILWNWSIFGEPLYFIFGEYSAYAQQRVLSSVGQLPTEKNLYNATLYYFWGVIENNGAWLVFSSLAAMFAVPFLIHSKKYLPVVLVLLTPFAFNIIALFIGQSAMNVLQAPTNPGLFNIRYGIMMLPGIALLLGIIGGKVKFGWLAVIALLGIQTYHFLQAGHPIVLTDGLKGLENTYYTIEASQWLAENYEGGLILTSLASHDAFVARAQIPMKNYIHEGNAEFWDEALLNPSQRLTYITVLVQPPDSVYRALKDNQDFKKNFELVHEYKEFQIYRKKQ